MSGPAARPRDVFRTAAFTAVAMLAFAANSLLCRVALGQQLIDAASFTSVRILAGAITLGVIAAGRSRKYELLPNWMAVVSLSCYMACFSFAYLTLTAGTGALLLFGAVQLTMFAAAIREGEKLSALSWAGLLTAFSGLVYLIAPGVAAPDLPGAALMVTAGVAWGIYSLLGRSSHDPLASTASNFICCVPIAIALSAIALRNTHVTGQGALLGIASGALASGIGYAIWYAALRGLRAGQAATVQLSVPVIAATGGTLILLEPFTLRLAVASVLTLGGIWLVLSQHARPTVRGCVR